MAELKDLMENEDFLTSVADAATPADLAKILDENGVELNAGVSIEEAFDAIKNPPEEELDLDSLDDVSGGVINTRFLHPILPILLPKLVSKKK